MALNRQGFVLEQTVRQLSRMRVGVFFVCMFVCVLSCIVIYLNWARGDDKCGNYLQIKIQRSHSDVKL